MTYWLKPIGTSESPISSDYKSNFRVEQYFSVSPNSVRVGDILITYAVGHKLIEGVFQVVKAPTQATEEDIEVKGEWRRRFNYSTDTNNLNKSFSDNWKTHRLNIFDYERAFLNSEKRVAPTNSNSLNSLKLGKDKVRLSDEFAKHLIEEMSKRT